MTQNMQFSNALTTVYNSNECQKLLNVTIKSDCDFYDISILSPGQKSIRLGTLYFADAGRITEDTTIPMCLLYYNEFPEKRAREVVNSARIDEGEFASIFQIIKNELDRDKVGQDIFPHVLNMFFQGAELNDILTELNKTTGNLFAIIDSTGKLIAKNDNFYVDYPVWMKSLDQGYCVDSLMYYIEEERKKNGYSISTMPFSVFCKHLKTNIFCTRIVYGNFLIGYIFDISKSGIFSVGEQQVMPLLSNAVYDIVMKNSCGRRGDYRSIAAENLLSDILSSAQDEKIAARLNFSKIEIPKVMRIIVVYSLMYHRDELQIRAKVMPEVAKIFGDTQMTISGSHIAALFETDEKGKISSEEFEKLNSEAAKHKLIMGVSDSFTNPDEIYSHYDQAKRALDFGESMNARENIFFFSDYIYYVLLDQVDDKSLFQYVRHPALDILHRADAEKNTELYRTLRIYTQTGFNKVKTAELMFLHRNTVSYRIQQIESLCGIDLSDANLLFSLQMSFLIDSYQNNKLK